MIKLLQSGLTSPQEGVEISYSSQNSAQQPQKNIQKIKVNLEDLFKEKKHQSKLLLFTLFIYHLTLIIIAAILQKGTSRLIKIYLILFISTETFFIFLCFMLVVILQRREFKELKNNNIISIQDLSSYLNLLRIMFQQFFMFKLMYQFLNILQLAAIGMGIYINIIQSIIFYLQKVAVDNLVLIISILIGVRIIIEILILKYTKTRANKVNVALNYSSYTIISGQQCEQCVICLQNLRIGQQINHLPCNQKHVFHTNCISEWLNKFNNCPICREIPNYF